MVSFLRRLLVVLLSFDKTPSVRPARPDGRCVCRAACAVFCTIASFVSQPSALFYLSAVGGPMTAFVRLLLWVREVRACWVRCKRIGSLRPQLCGEAGI